MTLSPASTQNYALRQAAEESPFIVPFKALPKQMARESYRKAQQTFAIGIWPA
jgi:hypothetical protein